MQYKKKQSTFTAKALLYIACCLLMPVATIAQTSFCPPNIDFENGTLSNWEFFTGSCCPISTTTNSGPVNGRHTSTSGNGVDMYGNFPIVAPYGGNFSLMLGNTAVNGQAERAKYNVHVPNGSGKYILLFRYAVVLQDPNHGASEQPRFEVRAFDSATSAPLPCAQYEYISSSNLPGFILSSMSTNVYFKPWTTGTIDLTGYAGRTVSLEFSSGDCSAGGHFGYGYVDMNCGLFQIEATACDSSSTHITFNGPPGYQSYEWRDSALTTVLSPNQKLVVPTPTQPTSYAVILTPYTGFGCKDTLYTRYISPVYSSVTAVASNDTTICAPQQITISVNASGPHGPHTYQWSPSTWLNCSTCANPVVTGSVPITYAVIATNTLGCSDTDSVFIQVDSLVWANLMVSDDTICIADTISVINTALNDTGRIYTWSILGTGSFVSSSTKSDTAIVHLNNNGLNHIILKANLGPCLDIDTATVYTGGFIKTMMPDDSLCLGDSISLYVTTLPQQTLYQWSPAATLSCSTCMNPIAKPTRNTRYKVILPSTDNCPDSAAVTIFVDSNKVYANLTAPNDSLCLADNMMFVNTLPNTPANRTYTWNTDGGTMVSGGGLSDSTVLKWTTAGYKNVSLLVKTVACKATDTVTVYAVPDFTLTIPGSDTLCLGESKSLAITQSSILPLSFNWVPATFLSCSNCSSPVAKPTTGTTYTLYTTNGHGCYDTTSVTLSVDTMTSPKFVPSKNPVCVNEVIYIKNTGDNPFVTNYLWYVDTANILYGVGTDSISLSWATPGTKKVIHRAFQGICTSADSVDVKVVSTPQAGFDIPQFACVNSSILLSPVAGGVNYTWTITDLQLNNGSYQPSHTLTWSKLGTKTVKLKVSDEHCADSFSRDITVHPLPIAEIIKPNYEAICKGTEFTMETQVGGRYTYAWKPATAFSNNNEPKVTAVAERDEQYFLEVINQWGCVAYDTAMVYVKPCCDLFMPGAFTPNSDGTNDIFHAPQMDKHVLIQLLVANRWGEIVYDSRRQGGKGWDGTHNGAEAAQSTYSYYLKYKCEGITETIKKGTFILIR